MNERNCTIDFIKYMSSLLVIIIHTHPFMNINSSLEFISVNIISRNAVPFFAICTGYFLSSKYKSVNNQFSWLSHWKKMIIIYFIWTVVYLIRLIPDWISSGWFSMYAFIDFAIATVFSGSYYHLWYILSIIYAIPLFIICLKKLDKKSIIYLSILLWGIKALSYGYFQWLPQSLILFFNFLKKISGLRDAVFCILPLMLLGSYISTQTVKSNRFYIVGLMASSLLYFIEIFILEYLGQEQFSFIFFIFFVSFFLFNLLLKLNINDKRNISFLFGKASIIIYLVHPLVIDFFKLVTNDNFVLFVMVAIFSTIFGVIYVILIQNKSSLKKKYLKGMSRFIDERI